MSNQKYKVLSFISKKKKKIFVVSLNRSLDRHEHLKKELAGLKYEIIWGVDGQDYTVEQMKSESLYDENKAVRVSRRRKKMKASTIACAISHRQICEKIVEENIENALVLEDDVKILQTKSTQGFNSDLPANWDLIYLGYWKNETRNLHGFLKQSFYLFLRLFGMIRMNFREILSIYPTHFNSTFNYSGLHEGAYAYAVSQRCARKIIELNTPVIRESDSVLKKIVADPNYVTLAIKTPILAELSAFPGRKDKSFESLTK